MSITWRRLRAGEYGSEAGRVVRFHRGWYVILNAASPSIWKAHRYADDAKAACEEAWRRSQGGAR